MANIPSINRTNLTYTGLKRRGLRRTLQTEESAKEVTPEQVNTDRRHLKDRRRKNIKVLFDRRKKFDRRHKGLKLPNQSNSAPRTGSKINTTA